jgi:hypothetical protein
MSRKPVKGSVFFGSRNKHAPGPWLVDNKPVTRGVFRLAYFQAFPHERPSRKFSIARNLAIRGRKRALDARRKLVGCEHDFEYHQDEIGDFGVVNGTYTERWLECVCCGVERSASDEDEPCYDDFF